MLVLCKGIDGGLSHQPTLNAAPAPEFHEVFPSEDGEGSCLGSPLRASSGCEGGMEKPPLHFSRGGARGVGRSGGSCRYDLMRSWFGNGSLPGRRITRGYPKGNAGPALPQQGHIGAPWGRLHVPLMWIWGGLVGMTFISALITESANRSRPPKESAHRGTR